MQSILLFCIFILKIPSFLLLLVFDWRTFSRRVTARWDVSQKKIKCRPIRTWELGGVSLSDVLYGTYWWFTNDLNKCVTHIFGSEDFSCQNTSKIIVAQFFWILLQTPWYYVSVMPYSKYQAGFYFKVEEFLSYFGLKTPFFKCC